MHGEREQRTKQSRKLWEGIAWPFLPCYVEMRQRDLIFQTFDTGRGHAKLHVKQSFLKNAYPVCALDEITVCECPVDLLAFDKTTTCQ